MLETHIALRRREALKLELTTSKIPLSMLTVFLFSGFCGSLEKQSKLFHLVLTADQKPRPTLLSTPTLISLSSLLYICAWHSLSVSFIPIVTSKIIVFVSLYCSNIPINCGSSFFQLKFFMEVHYISTLPYFFIAIFEVLSVCMCMFVHLILRLMNLYVRACVCSCKWLYLSPISLSLLFPTNKMQLFFL